MDQATPSAPTPPLTDLGMRIAIDDFGTGYSSLSYLHKFPIDTIKIDRSFISSMHERADSAQIVGTIVQLANCLGIEVIAEGIEDPQQVSLLQGLGCQFGQGYLFAKPLSQSEAMAFSREQARPQTPPRPTPNGPPRAPDKAVAADGRLPLEPSRRARDERAGDAPSADIARAIPHI